MLHPFLKDEYYKEQKKLSGLLLDCVLLCFCLFCPEIHSGYHSVSLPFYFVFLNKIDTLIILAGIGRSHVYALPLVLSAPFKVCIGKEHFYTVCCFVFTSKKTRVDWYSRCIFFRLFRFSFRDASYDDCGIDFCSFWSFMVRFQTKEDDRLRVLFMYRSLDFLCKGVLSVGYFIQSFKHILGSSGHSI